MAKITAKQQRFVDEYLVDLNATQAAGENSEALFHYLTTDMSWQEVTETFFISDRTLQRSQSRFYKFW